MDQFRRLHICHDLGLLVLLTFSFLDNVFSRFSKQSREKLIMGNKFAAVLILPAEFEFVLYDFHGQKLAAIPVTKPLSNPKVFF